MPIGLALDRMLEVATDRLDRMFLPDLQALRQEAGPEVFVDVTSRFICGMSVINFPADKARKVLQLLPVEAKAVKLLMQRIMPTGE